jgi:hypothetical protein
MAGSSGTKAHPAPAPAAPMLTHTSQGACPSPSNCCSGGSGPSSRYPAAIRMSPATEISSMPTLSPSHLRSILFPPLTSAQYAWSI